MFTWQSAGSLTVSILLTPFGNSFGGNSGTTERITEEINAIIIVLHLKWSLARLCCAGCHKYRALPKAVFLKPEHPEIVFVLLPNKNRLWSNLLLILLLQRNNVHLLKIPRCSGINKHIHLCSKEIASL